MNRLLFDRSTGSLSAQQFARTQTAQLIHSIQFAPRLRFNGGEREAAFADDAQTEGAQLRASQQAANQFRVWAHQLGVNALAKDIENRLTSLTHKFGISQLSFYPFDSGAFLSGSYDHHLKLYATDTMAVSADFDLGSIIYTQALSPIASHLLVACATQHPAVRLVDLRSGSSTHSLAGHHGALLSLSWSPTRENILASGGVDGTVRLWDVRKSSGALGMLDMEDSTGITGTDGMGRSARSRDSGKAHSAAVNGLQWTGDGYYLISAGHDDRVRVWDTANGANTLASFGPTLKNGHLSNLPMIASPTGSTAPSKELLFYPNEKELLVFELHEGRLLKRLRVPGPNVAAVRLRTGEGNIKSRVTGLVWIGQAGGLFSSHTDGQIRAWLPRSPEDEELDREEEDDRKRSHDDESEDIRRRRKVLDDVFRDMTRQKITFG
ncbi:hypothetical protein PZA11_003767 [Diplocarpon coronariae]